MGRSSIAKTSLFLVFGAAALSACGDDATGGAGGVGGSGSGGDPSTSSSSVTTTNTTVTSTSSTGGATPTDDTFEGANTIDLNSQLDDSLDPTGDVDFYTFQGTKGQAVYIAIEAQGTALPFDADTIDTVITLFDEGENQIAANNDRVPSSSNDSELLTVLPADGKYYIRVTECWSSSSTSNCAGTADKSNVDYSLILTDLDPAMDGIVESVESQANTPITFASAGAGQYYLSLVYGFFDTDTDSDVFSLQIPADAVSPGPNERSIVSEYTLPSGVSGNGSTTKLGRMYLTDAADATNTPIALIDGKNYTGSAQLSPALDFSKTYLLWVERPANSTLGANDFYFFMHGQSTSNPLELDELGNDTPAGAETLLASGASYYVEGDLAPDADVDHFLVDTTGFTQAAFACTAQRSGSGLRGFRAELRYTDPNTSADTLLVGANEGAISNSASNYVNLPNGVSQLIFKVRATSAHDPNVTSSFYRCGVHLN
ncbi:MAG: PPC domain-containing protein [Polyangiaceae bacterium]